MIHRVSFSVPTSFTKVLLHCIALFKESFPWVKRNRPQLNPAGRSGGGEVEIYHTRWLYPQVVDAFTSGVKDIKIICLG